MPQLIGATYLHVPEGADCGAGHPYHHHLAAAASPPAHNAHAGSIRYSQPRRRASLDEHLCGGGCRTQLPPPAPPAARGGRRASLDERCLGPQARAGVAPTGFAAAASQQAPPSTTQGRRRRRFSIAIGETLQQQPCLFSIKEDTPPPPHSGSPSGSPGQQPVCTHYTTPLPAAPISNMAGCSYGGPAPPPDASRRRWPSAVDSLSTITDELAQLLEMRGKLLAAQAVAAPGSRAALACARVLQSNERVLEHALAARNALQHVVAQEITRQHQQYQRHAGTRLMDDAAASAARDQQAAAASTPFHAWRSGSGGWREPSQCGSDVMDNHHYVHRQGLHSQPLAYPHI